MLEPIYCVCIATVVVVVISKSAGSVLLCSNLPTKNICVCITIVVVVVVIVISTAAGSVLLCSNLPTKRHLCLYHNCCCYF